MTRALIIMTRLPEEGKTKTRLMPQLSPRECVELHVSFLKDLNTITKDLDAHTYIYYTPEGDTTLFTDIFSDLKGLLLQEGFDLGERMNHGLNTLLKDYDQVLLIGSDLPELEGKHLKEAYELLEEKDVVLGPTSDGGYYLVGLKNACPQLFSDKVYSTPTVFNEALEILKELKLRVGLLEKLSDVDLYEDLLKLKLRLKDGYTKTLLEEILD